MEVKLLQEKLEREEESGSTYIPSSPGTGSDPSEAQW